VGGVFDGNASSQTLTQPMLEPILTEAIARWQEAGAPGSALATLRSTPVIIADLPGTYVGRESANGVIIIDANAAGNGWFVDLTPTDDSKFSTASASPASGHVDLLTVVAHELGHVLGIAELANPNDVMFQDLALGVRKIPTAADVAQAGLQLVAAPTMPVAHLVFGPSVVDLSQVRRFSAWSLLEHDIGFGFPQAPEIAINPGLLEAIHSLVSGRADTKVVLTNPRQSDHLELRSPPLLPVGTHSVPKPVSDQWPRTFDGLSREQALDIVLSSFQGIGIDDLLNQLVRSAVR
jgi:hypothetical protein